MPQGYPTKVVPVSSNGQVINLAPPAAARAFAGNMFTPAGDFGFALPNGQLLWFRKGVPVQTDPAMVAQLVAVVQL